MIKNLITAGAYTSGNVPMSAFINTNQKYALNNNGIDIMVSGINNIIANVIVTATSSGALSLTLNGDGTQIAGAVDTQTVATGDIYTFHINDTVKTVFANGRTFANVTLEFNEPCTIVGGDIIAEYVR